MLPLETSHRSDHDREIILRVILDRGFDLVVLHGRADADVPPDRRIEHCTDDPLLVGADREGIDERISSVKAGLDEFCERNCRPVARYDVEGWREFDSQRCLERPLIERLERKVRFTATIESTRVELEPIGDL